ncbi:hypothetical protein JR316_0008730 [Psilocybe cubensis]|uniref:Uncharacterized protein n=1 Tax=Psilocybe cubensis TaxID=181762 RepID=A0ACB8GS73_PSICU|nr:hypothetical protein JR316_0008730 [Psilocybe cubensis]KAH9478277.1 hypothetical protein JR316_0008730 [Psilocybe cubensis]
MRLLSELEDENLESVFPSGGHAVENLGLLSELEDGNNLESVFPSGGHAVERMHIAGLRYPKTWLSIIPCGTLIVRGMQGGNRPAARYVTRSEQL